MNMTLIIRLCSNRVFHWNKKVNRSINLIKSPKMRKKQQKYERKAYSYRTSDKSPRWYSITTNGPRNMNWQIHNSCQKISVHFRLWDLTLKQKLWFEKWWYEVLRPVFSMPSYVLSSSLDETPIHSDYLSQDFSII